MVNVIPNKQYTRKSKFLRFLRFLRSKFLASDIFLAGRCTWLLMLFLHLRTQKMCEEGGIVPKILFYPSCIRKCSAQSKRIRKVHSPPLVNIIAGESRYEVQHINRKTIMVNKWIGNTVTILWMSMKHCKIIPSDLFDFSFIFHETQLLILKNSGCSTSNTCMIHQYLDWWDSWEWRDLMRLY